MKNSKYKAVIFDYDDTLVESRAPKWAQYKHVVKKHYNIDVTDEKLNKHWGKPLNILALELCDYVDTWENIFKLLAATKDDFEKNLYDGAVESVNHILEKNMKVGIISATTREFLTKDLESHNFPVKDFFIIQGAEDTEVHKPDPGVFSPVLEILEKEGVIKEEIVYVGDALRDLEAAHGAGINFIAVTTGLYTEEDFKKAGAKTIAKDIKEVSKHLFE